MYLLQRDKEQGIEDKNRSQRIRKKGKGTRGRGKGYLSQKDKGLLLDAEAVYRQMVVYKGKGKPLVKMSWFILIGYVNYIWKPNSPVQD